MFRSFKVSVTLGAAVLIAAPGCCMPNLLCNHSSPSEETVVTGNSAEYVGDYSAGCSDCGCGCGTDGGIGIDSGFGYDSGVVSDSGYSGVYESGAVDSDKYLISSPGVEQTGTFVDGSSSSDFQPTAAEPSALQGSATKKVLDVVKPPADLKKPLENALPGNLLP